MSSSVVPLSRYLCMLRSVAEDFSDIHASLIRHLAGAGSSQY